MKVSTKGRYGLRALIDLAANSADGHVALNSIADRQGISVNYLEQVFSILRKAEIVKSVKGAQGGYALSERPSDIKVGTILRALEGSLSVTDADYEGQNDMGLCLKTYLWDRIDKAVDELIDGLTLEDMVNECNRLNANMAFMYNI